MASIPNKRSTAQMTANASATVFENDKLIELLLSELPAAPHAVAASSVCKRWRKVVQQKVQQLRLSRPLEAKRFAALGSNCINLSSLEITTCPIASGDYLAMLSSISGLKMLQVAETVVSHDTSGRLEVFSALQHLESLKMAGVFDSEYTPKAPRFVSQLIGLTHLSIEYMTVSREVARGLVQLSNLRHLELYRCEDLAEQDVVQLTALTLLTTLRLKETPDLAAVTLQSFPLALPDLRVLELGALCGHYLHGLPSELLRLTGLIELHLESCAGLTDEGVASLSAVTGLRCLGLRQEVTDSNVAKIAGLTQLTCLLLESSELTDDSVASVAALPGLQKLDLSRSQTTNMGVAQLSTLTQLTALSLNWCRKVSDSGLAHLLPLQALQRLFLHETSISAEGLNVLEALSQLTVLFLPGAAIAGRERMISNNDPCLPRFPRVHSGWEVGSAILVASGCHRPQLLW